MTFPSPRQAHLVSRQGRRRECRELSRVGRSAGLPAVRWLSHAGEQLIRHLLVNEGKRDTRDPAAPSVLRSATDRL